MYVIILITYSQRAEPIVVVKKNNGIEFVSVLTTPLHDALEPKKY